MGYEDFLNKAKISNEEDYQSSLEEAVSRWRDMTLEERADAIKEIQEGASPEEIAFIKEVAEKAKQPNTEAGGSGDETGTPIKAEKGGKGEDEVEDPNAETGSTISTAEAAGISAGVGALSLAKKLRSEQSKESE